MILAKQIKDEVPKDLWHYYSTICMFLNASRPCIYCREYTDLASMTQLKQLISPENKNGLKYNFFLYFMLSPASCCVIKRVWCLTSSTHTARKFTHRGLVVVRATPRPLHTSAKGQRTITLNSGLHQSNS